MGERLSRPTRYYNDQRSKDQFTHITRVRPNRNPGGDLEALYCRLLVDTTVGRHCSAPLTRVPPVTTPSVGPSPVNKKSRHAYPHLSLIEPTSPSAIISEALISLFSVTLSNYPGNLWVIKVHSTVRHSKQEWQMHSKQITAKKHYKRHHKHCKHYTL